MKYVVTLLAMPSLLDTWEILSRGSGDLAWELQEFVDLIPLDELTELTNAYWTQDKEFRLVNVLLAKEEKALIVKFKNNS